MDPYLMFKEHHNRSIKKARAAESQLRIFTKMHLLILERVCAVQIAWIQAVASY
jgi:hypothetical protein